MTNQETIIKAINEKLDKMTYEERETFLGEMGFVFEENKKNQKSQQILLPKASTYRRVRARRNGRKASNLSRNFTMGFKLKK